MGKTFHRGADAKPPRRMELTSIYLLLTLTIQLPERRLPLFSMDIYTQSDETIYLNLSHIFHVIK